MSRWPMVPLGEVVRHRKEFIQVDDFQTYKRCRVQLHAQGVVLRDNVIGAEIKTKKQQVCRAGELLVAEIDAKLGGYGIVPPELDGAIVSSHYFLFTVDEAKLDRGFLGHYIKTPAFFDQVAAQGSTNYASIRPQAVLAYGVPLPPLTEQQRLGEYIKGIACKVTEAKQLRQRITRETAALLSSARRRLLGDGPRPGWLPLRAFVQAIENGWSPACEKRARSGAEWGVLKVSAVSLGRFDPFENKALPMSVRPRAQYEVRPGDFLMSRANTYQLVGACALVKETAPRLILSDKHFRFILRDDRRVHLPYLNHVLKSPALRAQIVAGATGTSSSMKNISKAKVLALLVPNHGSVAQQGIAAKLDDIEQSTAQLVAAQNKAYAELDALVPALLDCCLREPSTITRCSLLPS